MSEKRKRHLRKQGVKPLRQGSACHKLSLINSFHFQRIKRADRGVTLNLECSQQQLISLQNIKAKTLIELQREATIHAHGG